VRTQTLARDPTTDDRRAQLVAALGFLQLPPRARELQVLHTWLDSWAGVGHVIVGMERQGFKVSIRSVAVEGSAASFQGSPMLSASGYATGPTAWAAVQRAAWIALKDPPQ
jgi:hypothetical protein